jgi:hypothetical protein
LALAKQVSRDNEFNAAVGRALKEQRAARYRKRQRRFGSPR